MWPTFSHQHSNYQIRNNFFTQQQLPAPLRLVQEKKVDWISFFAGSAATLLIPKIFRSALWLKHWVKIRRLLKRPHHLAGDCCGSDLVLNKRGFSVGYSFAFRSPVWASYFMCSETLRSSASASFEKKVDRTKKSSPRTRTKTKQDSNLLQRKLKSRYDFRPDPNIPPPFRTSLQDYNATGFDKGHCVAVANVSYSEESRFDTSFLTCVALQHPALNRHGSWFRLEKLTRVWAKHLSTSSLTSSPSFFAVCCGPVFSSVAGDDKKKAVTTLNGVGVPTHFFLAILHVKTGNSCAFLIPNDKRGGEEPLNTRMMSINGLERNVPSLKIFRNLPFSYRPYPWQRRRVDNNFWKLKNAAAIQQRGLAERVLFGGSQTRQQEVAQQKAAERVETLLSGRTLKTEKTVKKAKV